jgi:methylenetetrahydrofolate dehydrogenase (NADP+)/methenyltetrahydrofolate cyclohydrolase
VTRQLEGKPVAQALLERVKQRVATGVAGGSSPPVLASVHLGDEGPFSFYLRQQERTARASGIGFRDVRLPLDVEQERLNSTLRELDRDGGVHAILLQHPLRAGLDFFDAVSSLSPEKDVDGVGATNLGRLITRQEVHAPAVARAALQILSHFRIPVSGRRVSVVGRSATVGLPLAILLARRGPEGDATVTLAHSRSPDLKAVLAGSEVVVSCAGRPGLLTRENAPGDSVVVDIGLSSVPDPTKPSGARAEGDANAQSLDGWVSALTPVPGGVGPVTVAQLMLNTVDGWERLTGGPR